jgi:hypothetical protein
MPTGLDWSAGTASAHRPPQRAVQTLVMESGSLIVERTMLLGIRERAENVAVADD